MKKTYAYLPTYSADVFGVCSALYELGGMTVIHDSSGCNSTYTTHDEPRWMEQESMIFISALSETEAILGDDEKLITDIVETAEELKPRFITLIGSPIPAMIGFDYDAAAAMIEERTGLPTLGVATTGMHDYSKGIADAFLALSERFVQDSGKRIPHSVNILGATPLDYALRGPMESLQTFLKEHDYPILSNWAMGSSLAEIARSAEAAVNLVVSGSGVRLAKKLEERFGTPWVYALPVGECGEQHLLKELEEAERTKTSSPAKEASRPGNTSLANLVVIIGEPVQSLSLARFLEKDAYDTIVVNPLEEGNELLRPQDISARDEDDLAPILKEAFALIADPFYETFYHLRRPNGNFFPYPHTGLSGRQFRNQPFNLMTDAFQFAELYRANQ